MLAAFLFINDVYIGSYLFVVLYYLINCSSRIKKPPVVKRDNLIFVAQKRTGGEKDREDNYCQQPGQFHNLGSIPISL